MSRYESRSTEGFDEKIAIIKRVMGIKTIQLAKLIQTTPQSISNWLRGENASVQSHYKIIELYEASLMISRENFKFYPHMIDKYTRFGTIRDLIKELKDVKPAVREIIGIDPDKKHDTYRLVSEDLAMRIWNSLADEESTWYSLDVSEMLSIRNKLFSAFSSGFYMVISSDSGYVEYFPKIDRMEMMNE